MNIPENFDRWMFDYKEGNLSAEENAAFENFLIQNPEFEIESDAWNNSFIQNEEFIYPNAEKLEKDNRFVAGWYGYAAAAVALLLIGSSVMYFNKNEAQQVEGFSAKQYVVLDGVDGNDLFSARKFEQTRSSLIDKLNDHVNNESVNLAINAHNASDDNISVNDHNGKLSENNFNGHGHFPEDISPNEVSLTEFVDITENSAFSEADLNTDNTDPAFNSFSMDQEISKFNEPDFGSKYQKNPDGASLNFDMADANIKYDFKGNKLKKFVRKIERMFDYPVGLTNLRDPDYLMPNNSIVASNPGFAGGMLRPRTEINYRNQWFGSDQNSQQLTMSFDNYFYQMRGGVGLVINAKDFGYGEFRDYNMSLVYSPKLVLSQNVIFEPAVKLTMGAITANGNKLAPESVFEMDRGRLLSTPASQQMSGNQQLWYKDYGLGFVLNTKWFYAGFSADNLNKHYENVYNEEGFATPTSTPVLMNAILGTDYLSLNKEFAFSPFVSYQKFGDRQEIWGGAGMRYKKFIIGGSMSHNLDFTGSIGIKFEKFKLAYQYDQTKTTLTNESIGSHNLTLRFNGKTKPPRLK